MLNLFPKKAQCLLIDPGMHFLGPMKGFNFPGHFPFGALNIASLLQSEGIPTKVLALDCYFPMTKDVLPREQTLKQSEHILKQIIKDNAPLTIGISVTYTAQYTFALQLADLIKKISAKTITVMGGAHVSFLDERALRECPFLDIVVRGEGEWTMAEILSCVKRKAGWEGIAGISFRNKGRIARTEPRRPGSLSELPEINFGLMPRDFYKGRQINIALTRGCKYNCRFCAEHVFWGNQQRALPVEKLLKEANVLFNKYKISFLSLEDSMLEIGSEYFRRLSSGLIKIQSIRLGHMVTRVDGVDQENIAAAKKTGFQMLIYGVESGSEKVLQAMNKRITLAQVQKALKLTKEADLIAGAFWLIGHPGDNEGEASQSLLFMEQLYAEGILDNSTIARFIPYPGTDFFDNPHRYGIKILHYDWEKWRRYWHGGVCELADFSDAQISAAHEKAYQKSLEWKFCNEVNKKNDYVSSVYSRWGT